MITVGVQTKGIIPEYEPKEAAKKIAEAGFTKVDFNLDCFLKNSDIYAGRLNNFFDADTTTLLKYFQYMKEALQEQGITPSQMHAPYPIYVPDKPGVSQYMQQNVIPKSIAIAEVMEIPWVVMHPFKLQYEYGICAEHNTNLEYFKSLIPMLKQHKVKVCVENLYGGFAGRILEGTCADPEEASRYVDRLNEYAGEELFGICVDLGHLQLVKRDVYEYITKIGNRLKILHIHENDGEGDLHHMPYTFGGNGRQGRDWERFIQALREIGYDGTLSFETFPSMNSFPIEVKDECLRTICAIGNYWKNRIEE